MGLEFLDRLDGNSLDRVDQTMAIDDVRSDSIPPEDERKIRSLRTVQEAIDYIRKQRNDGGLN